MRNLGKVRPINRFGNPKPRFAVADGICDCRQFSNRHLYCYRNSGGYRFSNGFPHANGDRFPDGDAADKPCRENEYADEYSGGISIADSLCFKLADKPGDFYRHADGNANRNGNKYTRGNDDARPNDAAIRHGNLRDDENRNPDNLYSVSNFYGGDPFSNADYIGNRRTRPDFFATAGAECKNLRQRKQISPRRYVFSVRKRFQLRPRRSRRCIHCR